MDARHMTTRVIIGPRVKKAGWTIVLPYVPLTANELCRAFRPCHHCGRRSRWRNAAFRVCLLKSIPSTACRAEGLH